MDPLPPSRLYLTYHILNMSNTYVFFFPALLHYSIHFGQFCTHADCLRSSTNEVYEAYHCAGAFTSQFRAEAGVQSLVFDAATNPCCRQAAGVCQADGRTFPFNAAYYTTSWLQHGGGTGRTNGRRAIAVLEDDSTSDHDGDADFVFVDAADVHDSDEDYEDHEGDHPLVDMDEAQRKLKGSKGYSSSGYYR